MAKTAKKRKRWVFEKNFDGWRWETLPHRIKGAFIACRLKPVTQHDFGQWVRVKFVKVT